MDDRNSFSLIVPTQDACRVLCAACNNVAASQGLALTPMDVAVLQEQRIHSLQAYGRYEYTYGLLDRLVYHFCDSPYINQSNFITVLAQLQDLFYYFKTESRDKLDDDTLLELMKRSFDTVCHGSLEFLSGMDVERLLSSSHYGYAEEVEDGSSEAE